MNYFLDAMKYKISDGFCLVCSKANKSSDEYLSVFGCDGEHFGLCGKIYILIICHATINLFIIIYFINIMITETEDAGVSLI